MYMHSHTSDVRNGSILMKQHEYYMHYTVRIHVCVLCNYTYGFHTCIPGNYHDIMLVFKD